MRNWSLTVLSVGAMALPQMPSHALGSSLNQICQASGQSGGSHELGLEAHWRDSLRIHADSGLATVQKKFRTNGSRSFADVIYTTASGSTKLIRLPGKDPRDWEGRLGLIDVGGKPVMLGAVTEAGMRYVGVALWTLVGPGAQPHRIGVPPRYRRVLKRAEMGGGPVGSSVQAPIFSNPRLGCEEGEAWLIEEWFVLGQQGVACWKFDEVGNVIPVVAYRNSVDYRSDVAGARSATITRIYKYSGGTRTRNIRMAEPPDIAEGFPTCDEILEASRKAAGVPQR